MTVIRSVASKLPNRFKVMGANIIAASRRQLSVPCMLPSFLIVGAQKAGTSSMFQYLSCHPSVLRPVRKDVFYFDRNFDKNLEWYSSYFATIAERERLQDRLGTPVMTFEGATYYIFHPLAAARIRQVFPEMKIIVLLRDPTKRAVSHYRHNRHGGVERLPMMEAFRRESERLAGEVERIISDPRYDSYNYNHFSYLARGLYADQLERWHQIFPRQQILLLFTDDFFANPAQTFRTVCRFVGLPEISLPQYPQVGASSEQNGDLEAVAFARSHFEKPNERLFGLLGIRYNWI